jgi:hypothetical protein
VENLVPGKYTLEIKVVDRIANQSLVTATDFGVVSPSPRKTGTSHWFTKFPRSQP